MSDNQDARLSHPTITVVYQDDDIIAVNKPAGLLCVPGLSHPDNLFDRVKRQYPNARVVHRLDMATSGLVIFALHHSAQKHLGQQFETRKIFKKYIALVSGATLEHDGTVEAPLICDWPNRPKQMVDWIKGKSAKTRFHVTSSNPSEHFSRVELFPLTGRTHQLRVHMMHIGHPILGDNFYYPQDCLLHKNLNISRLHLHAEEMQLAQPITAEPIRIECPAPF